MFKRVVLDNFRSFPHLDLDLTETRSRPARYALVYGENGSGKTNVVRAFRFLRLSVRTLGPPGPGPMGGLPSSDREYGEMFRRMARMLDSGEPPGFDSPGWEDVSMLAVSNRSAGSAGAMRTEYVFAPTGKDADYVMEFGEDGRLIRECLDYHVNGRKARLYEVVSGPEGPEARFHASFFRSAALEADMPEALRRFWGKHTVLSIIRAEARRSNPEYIRSSLCPEATEVLQFIRGMTVGLREGGGPGWFDPAAGTLPASARNILDAYEDAATRFFSRINPDIRRVSYDVEQYGGRIRYEMLFERRVGTEYRLIRACDESFGTRRLLGLLPYLMSLYKGGVVVIDEMDSGIHDVLMRDLMREVLGYGRGQLVATTHNTSLLRDADPKCAYILRDAEGGREIVAISSITRTQRNNNNEDRYLNGVFGGVPTIGEVDMGDIVEAFDRIREGGRRE
ncbi:MAG: AAA family ATPase [Thermoplasmata archaeon]|nr:AAA family ATPase [Thermoplasmata archaeon]